MVSYRNESYSIMYKSFLVIKSIFYLELYMGNDNFIIHFSACNCLKICSVYDIFSKKRENIILF